VSLGLTECYELCEYFRKKIEELDPAGAQRYMWRCRSKCRKRGAPLIPVVKLFRNRGKEKGGGFRSLQI